MVINFYKNTSDNNVLNKNITLISTHNIKLKDECNIMTPSILIHGDISNDINYAYIEKWGRYYYVRDKKSLNNGIYEINLTVDVLMSFKQKILTLKCIIDKQQDLTNINKYYNDGSFIVSSKEFIKTINFPNGFNENGEFILITAGGNNNELG